MASGLTRPLALSLKGRMFSAAAAAQRAESTFPQEKEPKGYVRKLDNGMLVGTIENQFPVSRLAVYVNAGPRHESGDDLGVAHFLRHSPAMRTENMSSIGMTRAALQLGSDITSETSREYIVYKGSVTRNCAGKVAEILRELATKQTVFRPWEVKDVQDNGNGMKLELEILKNRPIVRLFEHLHAAAFRDTLGRSLYAPDYNIGKYTPGQLNHYVRSYFGTGRVALVGVGIDHRELEEMAAKFDPLPASTKSTKQAVYAGGEVREDNGGDTSYVAVAFGGPSQVSKDLLPAQVLRHILGIGPTIKYSEGQATSKLGKAVAKATSSPFNVEGLCANYSDAGLFGFSAMAPTSEIDSVVRAASDQFQTLLTKGVSDADVDRAKVRLQSELCMKFEHPDLLLSWLGEQSLHCDAILTPQEIYKLVNPITTADVNKVAKEIASTHPSMAVTGNATAVPYLDQFLTK